MFFARQEQMAQVRRPRPTSGISGVIVMWAMACGGTATHEAPSSALASPATSVRSERPETQNDTIRIGVNRNVELFAILFRLAGNPEYQTAYKTPYLAAVEKHFAEFREHPAVVASRELRSSHGISFNAPVGLAAYLTEAPDLRPIRRLSPVPENLDDRWADVDLDSYLAQVRSFVVDSGFAGFMDQQDRYFTAVTDRFRTALNPTEVVSWFDSFFGHKAEASYFIVPGLLMGGNNYGATADTEDGRELLF
jgi:hypothetical protein